MIYIFSISCLIWKNDGTMVYPGLLELDFYI